MDQAALIRLFQQCRQDTDDLLTGLADEFALPAVQEFVGYAVAAGRRFRAFLANVCFRAAGGHGDHVRFVMGAVELLHKASLIHDDVVDDDSLRRGRETFHHKFGSRAGIVVGDLVAALAFDLIGRIEAATGPPSAGSPVPDDAGGEPAHGAPADVVACYRFLSSGYRATAFGELEDLLMEGQETVSSAESEVMLTNKSGWLVATACGLGASAAGASREVAERFHRFGLDLGTGFQILNDVNSLTDVDTASKGVVGGDVAAKKKSLPVVLALAGEGVEADELRRLWAKPQVSEADAARAVSLIEATGALDTCRARAQECLTRAAGHLADVPDTPFTRLLRAVPSSTITDAYWREMD